MMFKEGSRLYATELERRQGDTVLYINYLSAPFVPSIADNAADMARTVDLLVENPGVTRIVFVQQRNYHYTAEQVQLLADIAALHTFLVKQEALLSVQTLRLYGNVAELYSDLSYVLTLLRQDPVACYLELKRRSAQLKEELAGGQVLNSVGLANYIRLLERILGLVERTKLMQVLGSEVRSISVPRREVYRSVFRPEILPNFTFTRLAAHLPDHAELVNQYELTGEHERATVTILRQAEKPVYFYHVLPPEYALSEEHHLLLTLARNVLLEHRPKAEEFTDPEKTRSVFFNVARDLLNELSQNRGITLSYRELQTLAHILVRYTIGFGLLEILLLDKSLQDIVLNAPIPQNPIFVRHEQYDECVTNIVPSTEDADSWAAKLRLQSGRPLDEANPVLDTELVFGGVRARIAAVKEPLSPHGLAYALRRHREQPWTLPLFIQRKMLNAFAAGLLSFFVEHGRTLLVAGTRSSGKTSVLGSLMLEIVPKYRILVIEDTLELPVDALRSLGYDVLRMKVRSALTSGTTEIEAAEGIRTSLRLGDSALIVGEVRSEEAKALYEAMRVGALANVVAGTIHGDSPYGVFDRVVNDLGVPVTSFKATDIIVIANPVKSADGLSAAKRVVRITEVRKHWTSDPLRESGFVDLMRYNVEKDELEPTQDLINGESEIVKSIASHVKGWAGNWDTVYDAIVLRGLVQQAIVEQALVSGNAALLEAGFVTRANIALHRISEEVLVLSGVPKSEQVMPRFLEWLRVESGKGV